ncbi:hypothetical protein RIF29_05099 [Crotalaria pallida]|uniref:Uncharacterized protein n=1 Tax=Crotalaria pallida TaxID=3830 RepID=A0AAN9J1N2_CROPI
MVEAIINVDSEIFCEHVERRGVLLDKAINLLPYLCVLAQSILKLTQCPEFSHLLYICLDLMGCIVIVESSMMIIASLVPNFLLGLIIGAGYIGVMMMTADYFRQIHDLPKVF